MNFLTQRNKLTRSLDSDRSKNFIALAMSIGSPNGIIQGIHSGILICLRGELQFFHWDQKKLTLEKLEDYSNAKNVYHRETQFFPVSAPYILDAIVARFRLIEENNKIVYSMILDPNSFYDENGIFHGTIGLPEMSSCVGFCINVFRGLLFKSKNFFEVTDWNVIDIESHEQLKKWFNEAKETYPELSEEVYKDNHRRIKVNELMLSAYLKHDNLPVRKTFTDDYGKYFNPYVNGLKIES